MTAFFRLSKDEPGTPRPLVLSLSKDEPGAVGGEPPAARRSRLVGRAFSRGPRPAYLTARQGLMGGHEMVAQTALANDFAIFHRVTDERPELGWLRASGLAQARLQLAVLSGNRRRALEQIDRLLGIDRQLERLGRGEHTLAADALEADLAEQRLAIASEKLALTSGIELPRLEPAFGAGMGEALAPDEEVEIVEHETLKKRLLHVLLWAAGFLVLCIAVAAAAAMQL